MSDSWGPTEWQPEVPTAPPSWNPPTAPTQPWTPPQEPPPPGWPPQPPPGGWQTPPSPGPANRGPLVVIGIAAVGFVLLIGALVVIVTRARSDVDVAVSPPATPTSTTAPPATTTPPTTTSPATPPLTRPPRTTVPEPDPEARYDLDQVVALDDAEPQEGGTLTVAVPWLPDSLSPASGLTDVVGLTVGRALYDPLAVYDADGVPRAYLAESIETTDGGTTWEITIRPDVQFHDGTDLTAQIVVDNLLARTENGSVVAGLLDPIDAVEAVDEATVTITMSTPWASFPHVLTGQVGLIAAPSTLAEERSDPIGTGPFLLDDFRPDRSLSLVRNEAYWQESGAHLDAVDLMVIPGPTAGSQSLQAGEVDVWMAPDPYELSYLEDDFRIFEGPLPDSGPTALVLNAGLAPFDDLVARQAISAAIDVEWIADEVGTWPGARTLLSPTSPLLDFEDPQITSATDAARLLDEYESTHGEALSFDLSIASDQTLVGQVIQAQLEEVGVSVRLNATEQTALVVQVLTGRSEAALFRIPGSVHPNGYGGLLADGVDLDERISTNLAHLDDPRLLAAVAAVRAAGDGDATTDAIAELDAAMAELVPWVLLDHTPAGLACTMDVTGLFAVTLPDGKPGMPSASPFLSAVSLTR